MGSSNIEKENKYTYRRIRKVIGILGVLLPMVLVLLSVFWPTCHGDENLKQSISAYYYSPFRDIFCGALYAIGLFMVCYKGHGKIVWWKNDNFLTNFAGVMAFGVAFFPHKEPDICSQCLTMLQNDISIFHLVCAVLLFVSFSLLSMFSFAYREDPKENGSRKPYIEYRIYKICGVLVLVFTSGAILSYFFWEHLYLILIFEALALFAFGFSWLVKGRVIENREVMGITMYED
jgi:hypothetical protein